MGRRACRQGLCVVAATLLVAAASGGCAHKIAATSPALALPGPPHEPPFESDAEAARQRAERTIGRVVDRLRENTGREPAPIPTPRGMIGDADHPSHAAGTSSVVVSGSPVSASPLQHVSVTAQPLPARDGGHPIRALIVAVSLIACIIVLPRFTDAKR